MCGNLKEVEKPFKMEPQFHIITSDFLNLVITSSGEEYACTVERRFPKSLTIAEVKGKMELQTGGNASTMRLELYDKDDKLVCKLDRDEALLGSYPADSGMRLHVIDKFLLKNEFSDTSRVEKYDLPIEEYNKRTDTVKSFLKQNKLGKYDEKEMAARAESKKKELESEIEAAKKCNIDDRCEIKVPGQGTRRGQVKYVGETTFAGGWWIGVVYDEPLGKNDGSVDGKKYFECPPKYGGFVRPVHVTTGDFPVLEDDLDEEL